MSLNNITISTAKWLTTKNNLQGCMILAIQDGQVKAVSYGADKHKCRQLAALVDRTVEAVESGAVNLSCFEPDLSDLLTGVGRRSDADRTRL